MTDIDTIPTPTQNALQEIFDNSKKYIDIAERRSIFYHDIENALDMVRDFIIQKNRIIYGGMAIDLSLKLAKHVGIYAENAIPDYDFMSPDFYNDSNELADLFAKNGFVNISAINALHITTRRVRINFIPVADITYIPPEIYDTLPTLTVSTKAGKIRIIHPDYQRLDMHRAFCIPYENQPQEVFMGRARKDQKRFHLLTKTYPIESNTVFKTTALRKIGETADRAKELQQSGIEKAAAIRQSWKETDTTKAFIEITLPDQPVCIGGFLAYGFYYSFYKALLNAASKDVLDTLEISIDDIALMDVICENVIKLYWPYDLPTESSDIFKTDNIMPIINLISDDTAALVKSLSVKKTHSAEYYPYLDDFRPETTILSNNATQPIYEIYDNYGKLLPAWKLNKLLKFWKLGICSDNISLASIQYVLLYFLLKSYECPKLKDFYLKYYCSTEKMVITAEKLVKHGLDKLYSKIPFFLTADIFGTANISPTYIAYVKEKMAMLIGQTIQSERPIFGYYPNLESPGNWPKFDAAAAFHTDGSKKI
jgi:hypothetical protein